MSIDTGEIGSVIKIPEFTGNLFTSKVYFAKVSLMAQNLQRINFEFKRLVNLQSC